MPLGKKTTSTSGGALQDMNLTQRIPSELQPPVDNECEFAEHRSGKKALRRSKNAGQSSLTPCRRTGVSGNSKSCPLARLKGSPTKDVMKHSKKKT